MTDLEEQIKARATVWDAAAILGIHLPMRAGAKLRVPWREDRKPSATIMANGARVIDWSTGESEDAAGLIRRVNGAGYHLALNLLAHRLGMGEPFPDAHGYGRSRLIFASEAREYDEPAEPEPTPAIEAVGIANFTTVSDVAADEWLRSVCEHLAGDLELADEIAQWRGLPVKLIQRLAREQRLGSDGRSVWLPCLKVDGRMVRAQVRRIGPREAGCEFFWPRESPHKPGPWVACQTGRRIVVAEGWGDAAAYLAAAGDEGATVIATLGTGVRKLEAFAAEAALILRQNDRGDANARWARSVRALWPTISVKSVMPPAGQKDWNDAVKALGVDVAGQLIDHAQRVDDDEVPPMGPEMAGRRFNAFNESMASEVFIEQVAGDLLHDDTITESGEWYAWRGTHWQPGADKAALERAKQVQLVLKEEAREMSRRRPARRDGQEDQRRRAPNELLEAFAAGCGQMRTIKNFMSLAASDDRLAARFADVRLDPLLLPCRNGVFDLRQRGGGFRDALRSDYITRRIGVAFDEAAECPLWTRVVEEIFESDRERMDFLQRWFGYCLTGYVHEQKLLFLYGTGANGKSTMSEVLKELLGELGVMVPQTMVVLDSKGGDAPDYEVIRLRGARMALAPEIDKNAKLNEARVKSLTGGDTMRGREHYEMSMEFAPTHKLMFYGNHKPMVHGVDDGVWRRFIFVHLRRKFEGRAKDPALKEKLVHEMAGILNWAIVGCWDWQRVGLAIPESVAAELGEYREASDAFASFLEVTVQRVDSGMALRLGDMRKKLHAWAQGDGERWMADWSVRRLRREMEDRGWTVEEDRKGSPFVRGMWIGEEQSGGEE